MIPESEQHNNHVIDLISTAAHHMEDVEREGVKQRELVLDPESLYWSTRIVNSNTFGRFIYELKNLESLAYEAVNHMHPNRAKDFQDQILRLVNGYKKSIDGKSSETFRDGHNSTMPLVDRLQRNKQERVYSVSDEMKKGIFAGLFGRDEERES